VVMVVDGFGMQSAAIAELLRVVPTVDGITMGEAAKEVGISRNMAYKMLRRPRE
jgi:transposase